MNEIVLDGKIFISSKRAAEMTGYAKDYVGQLCREGRVEARLVGRNWYVLKDAITDRKFEPSSPSPVVESEENAENQTSAADSVEVDTAPVTYVSEIYQQIPSVNRLAVAREEEVIENKDLDDTEASSGVMDKLNDAWSTWFSKEEEKEAVESVESKVEIDDSGSEKVNLRRIREYTPAIRETISEEPPILEEKSDSDKKVRVRRRKIRLQPLLINSVLVVIAAFAMLIGYAGSRFYTPDQSLPGAVNSVAGVGFYTKG